MSSSSSRSRYSGTDRRPSQRGEQVELRLRVVESETIHQESGCFAEVFHSFFGKPGDERDGGGDMMAVRAPDHLSGLRQVEVLADEALLAAGSSFDTEENPPATGPGHQGDQFGIDTIGSGAATPLKSFSAGRHGLTEGHNPFAVRGEHVVDEVELFDAIDLPDRSHLLDDPLEAT